MKKSARAARAIALLLGLLPTQLGCEWLANLDHRSAYKAVDASSVTTAAPDPDLTNCKLADTGAGNVRFANLVPTSEHVDICLRPSSAESFAAVRPLFQAGGPTCGSGLAYKVVTTPISIPPDTYDVKVVAAGAKTCEGDALATLNQVLVAEGATTALTLFGNGQAAPAFRRFDETRPKEVGTTALRLVHGAPDLGPLDFGFGTSNRIPSQMSAVRIRAVPYQDVRPGAPPAVDNNGYTVVQLSSATLTYAVASTGSPDATFALTRRTAAGASYSFFVVGRTDVPDFPLEVFACDETRSAGVLARCSDGQSLDVTVDTLNVQLSGALSTAEAARRPAAIAAAGALDGDIACITEAFAGDDKQAIIEAAKSKLPYSYFLPTTFESTPNDPRTLSGKVPPDFPLACPASQLAQMNALVDCARDRCSTELGSEEARAVTSKPAGTCLATQCGSQNISLFLDSRGPACGICVLAQYQSYERMKDIRSLCSIDPRTRSAFRGANGSLLLSRYPFVVTEGFLFPHLFVWNSAALHATVRVDNGAELDVFCGATSTVFGDCTLARNPLPTYYGESADGSTPVDCIDGSMNAQRLLHTQLRDWVKARAGVARSKIIVSGDFYSGPALGNGVGALNPENFAVLAQSFGLGIPAGFSPVCLSCDGNPLRASAGALPTLEGAWTRGNLLQNIPVTAVRSLKRTNDATVLDADVGEGDRRAIPISQYYGVRTVLRIAP